jgi:branched-chain amino acid transport system substrate-binding protein
MTNRYVIAVLFASITLIAPDYLSSPSNADALLGVATPLSGPVAWAGGRTLEGAEWAVSDLNKKGGVLGERIRVISVDDYCSDEQGAAAANKLVEVRVAVVVGHDCSSSAIAASSVYEKPGILMISTSATNTLLTEMGLKRVFRVVGRDDMQGSMAGEFLAKRFADRRIAVLHDGSTYGKGLCEIVSQQLNMRGINEVLFASVDPGKSDYSEIVRTLKASRVDVLYFCGYSQEAALIARQAHDARYNLSLVGGDGMATEDFWMIAGPAAAEGTFITFRSSSLARDSALAKALAGRKAVEVQNVVFAYAAVQVWALAAEKAGTLQPDAVAKTMHSTTFDTVLGQISFDEKGDVKGYNTFDWSMWSKGDLIPLKGAVTR